MTKIFIIFAPKSTQPLSMPPELDTLWSYDPMQRFELDNEQIFKSLHESLFRPIRFFAGKIIADQAAAEDIATESFIKLWEHRDGFDSLAQIKKFLYTTTKNACLNHLRDTQRHAKIHQEIAFLTATVSDNTVEHSIIRTELTQLIWQELDHLPPACKQVCSLLLKERLSRNEIAERLGISVQNVDSQIARAAKRLRTVLLRRKLLLMVAFFLRFLF